jgi:hypothetical protein
VKHSVKHVRGKNENGPKSRLLHVSLATSTIDET